MDTAILVVSVSARATRQETRASVHTVPLHISRTPTACDDHAAERPSSSSSVLQANPIVTPDRGSPGIHQRSIGSCGPGSHAEERVLRRNPSEQCQTPGTPGALRQSEFNLLHGGDLGRALARRRDVH